MLGLGLGLFTVLFNSALEVTCQASEKIAIVKAVGEALTLGNKAKENAIENAKQKAVKKAVARFIAPSEDPHSLYQKTIANYPKYVKENVNILKTQKINSKLVVFCDLTVDFGAIQEDINREISKYQEREQNKDDNAVFLIRVTGLPHLNGEENKIPVMVLHDYGMAFSRYGFESLGSDVGGNVYQIMADSAKSFSAVGGYTEYRGEVIKSLLENVEVTFAVIGEIKLLNQSVNASGNYVEAECVVEVVKPKFDGSGVEVIGKFNDSYTVNARDEKEAAAIVCKKAAVNSSKYLAEITYNYWQSKANHVSQ